MVAITRVSIRLLEWRDDLIDASPLFDQPWEMPAEWLQCRISIAAAEEAESRCPERPEIDGVPFKFCNREWRRLKKYIQDDDELWQYSTPPETWANLCGECGYVLLRQGKVVAGIVTALN